MAKTPEIKLLTPAEAAGHIILIYPVFESKAQDLLPEHVAELAMKRPRWEIPSLGKIRRHEGWIKIAPFIRDQQVHAPYSLRERIGPNNETVIQLHIAFSGYDLGADYLASYDEKLWKAGYARNTVGDLRLPIHPNSDNYDQYYPVSRDQVNLAGEFLTMRRLARG